MTMLFQVAFEVITVRYSSEYKKLLEHEEMGCN